MASVTFDLASRVYSGTSRPAVSALDLFVSAGELVVLAGPSGCGKSTTLRMLAGLEEVTSGRIFIGEQDVTELPSADRDVAIVFESYALYPHMTVAENMAFALKLAGVPKAERIARVEEAAELLDLSEHLGRKPKDLSGSQRQRVAMARAIVRKPQVFLMDEPLGNLEPELRAQTRHRIATLVRRLGVTTLYATHDPAEAIDVGDRIAVLDEGVLQQVGSPKEILEDPANEFVADFFAPVQAKSD